MTVFKNNTTVCVCFLWRLKLRWVTRACVLSHLDLFGPNKRGPCLSGHWGLRATNRRCLLTTNTWAPPSLGPTFFSPSLFLSILPLISLSVTALCVLTTSLLGRDLAHFYPCHCGPFDVDYIRPFHRSCVYLHMVHLLISSVCLWIYISQGGYVVDGPQRKEFSLMC